MGRLFYANVAGIAVVNREKNIYCTKQTVMPSSKDYLDFVLDQLSGLEDITFRQMMGEYIIYYRGKVVGGIYDNRFLVKPTPSARAKMPLARFALPYDGAKEMLSVDEIDNRTLLTEMITAMYDELPEVKKKR